MIRVYGLLWLLGLVLWLACFVDAVSTREDRVRNLPKIGWILIVLFFPLVGSVAWIVAGRPQRAQRPLATWERAQPEFPEDDRPGRAAASDPAKDAEFLAQLRRRAEEQRMEYRRQQQQARREGDDDTGSTQR